MMGNDDPPEHYDFSIVQAYMAKDSPTVAEADYIYKYGAAFVNSLDLSTIDTEELKSTLEEVIAYFETTPSVYAKLNNPEKEEMFQTKLIAIFENIGNQLFHFGKSQKSDEKAVLYLELADDLYDKALKKQSEFFHSVTLDLLLNRIYVHIRLISRDTINSETHKQFIRAFINEYKILELNELLPFDERQGNMAVLKEYIDPATSKNISKRKRNPTDSTEEKLSAPPKKLRFLGNAEPVGPEPASSTHYQEIVNQAIQEFFDVTKGHLTKRLLSQIFLAIADMYNENNLMRQILLDGSNKGRLEVQRIVLVQTAYELATALGNSDAIKKLEQYRTQYQKTLQTGNWCRATPRARKNNTILKEIASTNRSAVENKIKKSGLSVYFKDFLTDHMAEIEVQFPESKNAALAHLLYCLGEMFMMEKFVLPKGISNGEIATIFMEKAAELNHPEAKKIMEQIDDVSSDSEETYVPFQAPQKP